MYINIVGDKSTTLASHDSIINFESVDRGVSSNYRGRREYSALKRESRFLPFSLLLFILYYIYILLRVYVCRCGPVALHCFIYTQPPLGKSNGKEVARAFNLLPLSPLQPRSRYIFFEKLYLPNKLAYCFPHLNNPPALFNKFIIPLLFIFLFHLFFLFF